MMMSLIARLSIAAFADMKQHDSYGAIMRTLLSHKYFVFAELSLLLSILKALSPLGIIKECSTTSKERDFYDRTTHC